MMDISSAAPSLSTWKMNNPRVMSKPPVLAEVDPVKHEIGSTTVVTGWSITNTGADSMMVGEAMSTLVGAVMPMMVGDAVSMSMSMVDDAMSMSMTGDAESTTVAGDEPSILVDAGELMEAIDAGRSMVVGEGAGKSVDPDPVVPMVGAN
jgi:hypothetical protein